jgi:hypothetical protein
MAIRGQKSGDSRSLWVCKAQLRCRQQFEADVWYFSVESVARRRGRPKKFSRPSRPVTLTLPADVIAALRAIDPDLSRAIVRVTQTSAPLALQPTAELTSYGDRAVITVPSVRSIERRIGVELVPLPDGRALISFGERLTIAELELRIGDLLTDPTIEEDERSTLEALAEVLRSARRSDGVAVRPRTIIVLERVRSRNSRSDPETASA